MFKIFPSKSGTNKINKKSKIFIGLKDIANLPMMFKKAFEENGIKCDYYTWSDFEKNLFGFRKDKTFFRFKHPPPFRILGKNPFWFLSNLLAVVYLLYSVLKYDYFFFISPMTFFLSNKDLRIIKLFNRKIIMMFTGCTERDVNFSEGDDEYICKNCLVRTHKWSICNDLTKKKEQVNRLERYSDKILGQDDTTGYVSDKSKLIWFYIISDYPKFKVDLEEKYNQEEIRIIHFPSNPSRKQSHIIIPILKRFDNYKNVKIIIKDRIWEREKIVDEISKAHILVNQLGYGYNTLPVEAMSYGCVVFNSNPVWFQRNVPEAPIIHITAETLGNTLEHYINNKSELREYAEKSIGYYYKYHSPKAVGNFYKNMIY